MPENQLSLRLEHHHIDGFDHGLRRRALVGLFGKELQAAKRNAGAALQDTNVVVAHIVPDDIRDAGLIARGSAHPEHIVIAPLDVERGVVEQELNDFIGVGAAVKKVADNVQVIHRETLDERRERDNELIAVLNADDRVQNALVVGKLVAVLVRQSVQQLIDDIAEFFRHRLSDLGARILRGEHARNFNHVPEGLAVPLRRNSALVVQALQRLLRIVNQRAQRPLFGIVQHIRKNHLNFFANHTRAVVHDMQKGIVLAVNVAHEVLGALREIHNRREVDNLRAYGLACREFLCQQTQIFPLFLIHAASFFEKQKKAKPQFCCDLAFSYQ